MNEQQFKVGDMVHVVFGNCPHTIGEISWSGTILAFLGCRAACDFCGTPTMHQTHAIVENGPCECTKPLSWLKRIEPPTKTKTTEREKEIAR